MPAGVTNGVGNDQCPKCGSTDLTRTYTTLGNLISYTCRTCSYAWTLKALDTP